MGTRDEYQDRDWKNPSVVCLPDARKSSWSVCLATWWQRAYSAGEKELFYFRALLQDWPATSFQDLRTVDGLFFEPLQTY